MICTILNDFYVPKYISKMANIMNIDIFGYSTCKFFYRNFLRHSVGCIILIVIKGQWRSGQNRNPNKTNIVNLDIHHPKITKGFWQLFEKKYSNLWFCVNCTSITFYHIHLVILRVITSMGCVSSKLRGMYNVHVNSITCPFLNLHLHNFKQCKNYP